ncbi:integrase [Mycolicibacterium sp. BK634]|uniref:tyrosine-type recombinase/integrase n=1 Tax=Mycolicibacterium sp. BK634 TaxID=2587099 RepID=UPI0016218456|nr:site-specific integrase [Mycolicibacterium sp. BK634]MBB3752392.1 integrase [Mycolicibacterium sp. BK634]
MARQRRGFGRIRQFKSGRWQASYTGPDGNLYIAPETFAAKMDAEGWLTDRRREIDRELWSPPATVDQKKAKRAAEITFKEYAETWVKTRTVRGRLLATRTREHYEDLLEDHINPTFGTLPVVDITIETVDRWYATTCPNAPTMKAHAYSLLKSILETARVRDRLISTNPCVIRGGGTSRRKSKTKLATLEQVEIIVEEMPDRFKLMIILALWTTLRFSELVELQRKDIDVTQRSEIDEDGEVVVIREGVINVSRGAKRTKSGWEFGDPKSEAGIRDVSIPPHVLPAVLDHLERYVATGGEALLFPPVSGDPTKRLQPSTFYRHYHRARAKAKRTDLRLHDLRHTGATMAARTGATLAELMARIGHSTPQAAMRYQHAAAGRDKEIAASMSKLAAGTV